MYSLDGNSTCTHGFSNTDETSSYGNIPLGNAPGNGRNNHSIMAEQPSQGTRSEDIFDLEFSSTITLINVIDQTCIIQRGQRLGFGSYSASTELDHLSNNHNSIYDSILQPCIRYGNPLTLSEILALAVEIAEQWFPRNYG
jgi:hypothetical protein